MSQTLAHLFVSQALISTEAQIDLCTVTVDDSIPHPHQYTCHAEKSVRETSELNDIIGQIDLVDIFGIFHLNIAKGT